MAIGQGKLISASDFQIKPVVSLSKTQSFSVSYGNYPTITLGTFKIPSDIYFNSWKAMCSISSGNPSTWQSPTNVQFELTPQEYWHMGSCMLQRYDDGGQTGASIIRQRYSSPSFDAASDILTDSNPPQRQIYFQMYTGGESGPSDWQILLDTTYTIKVTITSSFSTAYNYSNMVFNFKLWLY